MHNYNVHSYQIHCYNYAHSHIAIRYVATLYVAIIYIRMSSEMFLRDVLGCFLDALRGSFLDDLGMISGRFGNVFWMFWECFLDDLVCFLGDLDMFS